MEGDDWTTQDLTLRFHNPLHNKLSEQKLTAMLKEPDMVPFVNRLFFDRDENFELTVKPDICKLIHLLALLLKLKKALLKNFKNSTLKHSKKGKLNSAIYLF